MARIPDDELERLKREIDLAELVRGRGIQLEEKGKDLVGLCPFHEETTPSFRVSPSKNLFHCFGCGAKGSVVDLVMMLEGVSFRHAVEILQKGRESLSSEVRRRRPLKRSQAQKLPGVLEPEAGDDELRTRVADYYHQTLLEAPEALAYLKKRGLNPGALVDRFHLGFSNRTLGYHIPHSRVKDGKAIRGRLAALGIIKTTGHELLAGSLVIPILDAEGRVAQMYGRKIRDDLRAGTPTHLYLPGPRRGIFNLAALREHKEVILCEALVDALTFVSAGFDNVTSAYGINGFNPEHIEAFKAYGTERVLIAYDRDERGEPAAKALAERLGAEGVSCFRALFPRGMDANEFALKVTPAEQSLAVLLRSARYMAGPLKTLVATPTPAEPMNASAIIKGATSLPLAAASRPQENVMSEELPASAAEEAAKEETPPAASPASPIPPPPRPDIPAEISDHEVVITLGERRWRIRGLAGNTSYERLKVSVLVAVGERFHVDSVDLHSSKQRKAFVKEAASELGCGAGGLKSDLGKVFLKLEELQHSQIQAALAPQEKKPEMSDSQRAEAMKLLEDPRLLERVSADLETCGLVGEHTNKLVAYLAAISRLLEKPLGVMVQSSSAAGKSALMEAVLAFVPEEERVQYSAMTGQSLFYMGETDLQHKVLAIAEEEGAERASYPLKLLQSEGELTIASTGKDPKSGRLVTNEYHVEGPAAILLTTTAIDLDEELQNRCVVLAVDESREQTIAIHEAQRLARTRQGAIRRKRRPRIRALHQNAQRLLEPVAIRNPHSPRLTFPNEVMRSRRDQEKYLTLIEAIALLHQHQRQVLTDVVDGERDSYIEVTLDDIAEANRLASEALGRMLDELPPQTRRFLELVHVWVGAQCEAREIGQQQLRFSRREVLDVTGWSYPQVRKHIDRLVDYEYLLVHRGRRGQSFVYELLWQGEGVSGEPFLMGLIDVEKLADTAAATDTPTPVSGRSLTPLKQSLTPSIPELDPLLTPHCPPFDPPLTPKVTGETKEDNLKNQGQSPKNAHQGAEKTTPVVAAAGSYPPSPTTKDEQPTTRNGAR